MIKKIKAIMGLGAVLALLSVSGTESASAQTTANSQVNVSFGVENAPLRIDNVSNIIFGNHTISTTQQTYPANASALISLTDNRGFGASQGWELTATMSVFTNSGATSLDGAYLTLTNPDPESQGDFTDPAVEDPIELRADTTATVAEADRGVERSMGVGPNRILWNASDINLTVPRNTAAPGEHAATVTWALSDAPQ